MKTEFKKLHMTLLCCLTYALNFGQVQMPKTPTPATFQVITPTQYTNPNNNFPSSTFPTSQQNQMDVYEQDRKRVEQQQNEIKQINADLNADRINYTLPSYGNAQGTSSYYKVFENLNLQDTITFSVKDLNFQIENAYYDNQKDKAEFDLIIKNIGEFLTAKMKELDYDLNSNSAKNYMLFQFFSEKLKLKNGKEHLPFTYDFEDYMGIEDYSKMFVSKLLNTQTGQCHSMPLLYLILAEEIKAEAYLAYSPNHSYIKFKDEKGKWYNIELTNGMFSTTSFVLESGFIKSEALQNKIYMQSLSRKELLSQLYTDLANGYINKFGYDEFVGSIVEKALELSPNSIGANMVKANLDTNRFMYIMQQLGIDPNNREDLQNIRHYPNASASLQEVNQQYAIIDNLGYTPMPADAYQDWLQSMKEQKNIQDNQTITNQFKGLLNKKKPKN